MSEKMFKEIIETVTNLHEKTEKRMDKIEEAVSRNGVLLEQMDDKVKQVAEGHSGLNNKIDRVHEEVKEVKEELKLVTGVVRENRTLSQGNRVAIEKVDRKLDKKIGKIFLNKL